MAPQPSRPVEQQPVTRLATARIAIAALLVFMYFTRLGAGALWDNSEPTYGEIVKELFRTGDWLTLHFNYQSWFIHPPLWFWTAGLSAAIFGLNEFALRLPSALAGLLTAYAVYRAGLRLYGEVAALVAALAFGTSLEIFVLSRLAVLDSLLLLFTTIASLWIYFSLRDHDRRAFWIAVIAAALGTLTKGPIAVVLPLLTLLVYAIWTRKRIVSRDLPWLQGVGAYLIVAGCWFALESALVGTRFLGDYFGHSNVGRFLQPFENQPGPWWYYIPLTIIGFFPYVAFLPKALKMAWQSRGDAERYLICSAVVPFVFFSIAQTKLPNYIGVIFPALALLVGRLFSDAIRQNNLRTLRGALIMLPVALVLLTISIVLFGKLKYPAALDALSGGLAWLGIMVVPTAIATLIVTLQVKRVWVSAAGLAVMMAGFAAALFFVNLPLAETFKPMKAFSATVMSYWLPANRVGILGASGGYSLLYYTDARGVTFLAYGDGVGDKTPEEFFSQQARVLCVTRQQDLAELRQRGIHYWVLTHNQKLWLLSNAPPQPVRFSQ